MISFGLKHFWKLFEGEMFIQEKPSTALVYQSLLLKELLSIHASSIQNYFE